MTSSTDHVQAASAPAVDAVAARDDQPGSIGVRHAHTANAHDAPSPRFLLDPIGPPRADRHVNLGVGIDARPGGVRHGGRAAPTVVAGTKLAVPKSRRRLVPRPALCARFEQDHRVALVSAPAGYGKTAALAAWAAEHRDHVAWLSCDPSDAEPARFMSCLLSAIAGTWPGAADDAFVLLERHGPNTYDAAVAVANELAAVASPGVIVVDDLHLAAPDPTTLAAFIDALPDGFRFIAGTRSDPPLSLARLRLHGDLLELRRDELRFTHAELSEFFDLHAVSLTSEELVLLQELTEGWPAGAQLAAIALQGEIAHGALLDAFANTDRAVTDFLLSEVLAGLPAELVSFLVETSVLDTFDAEVCEAITGVDDAAVLLDRLLAADLFIEPLGHPTGSYRYHHLFGSFLRAQLASSGTSKLRAAHERASHVLERRGDDAGALQQAMAMSDADRVGRILRTALRRSTTMSDCSPLAVRAIRMWLHEFGASAIDTDPSWVVELLIGLISQSGSDDADAWLRRVRQAHPHADGELGALIEFAEAEHEQQRGQPLRALAHLGSAEDAIGGALPTEGPLARLDLSLATAHVQAGEPAKGQARIEQALTRHDGGGAAERVQGHGIGALAAAICGELARAEELSGLAEAGGGVGPSGDELGLVWARLAMAEVHLERNDPLVADQILTQIIQTSGATRRPPLQGVIALCRARLARALGDETNAAALLGQARHGYAAPDEALCQVLGQEAAAQALKFHPSTAAQAIAELDQDRAETQVLRARLALQQGDDRAAAALLEDASPPTTRRASVERSVLLALSVLPRDVGRANHLVGDALRAAQPERLIRTIIDPGPGIHRLLRSFSPAAGQERYVGRLLAASGDLPPAKVITAQPLIEPLSARELMVLRYLCTRLTYREIAAALFVSLNTLKSHVRSVYRKLAVESRADAVEAGRTCGLI